MVAKMGLVGSSYRRLLPPETCLLFLAAVVAAELDPTALMRYLGLIER